MLAGIATFRVLVRKKKLLLMRIYRDLKSGEEYAGELSFVDLLVCVRRNKNQEPPEKHKKKKKKACVLFALHMP